MVRSYGKIEDISELLAAWNGGDQEAWDRLVPIVYEELRRRARAYLRNERNGHTLRTTALVHEAYLRLAGQNADLENRNHFFALASDMMRRVLVDYARTRNSEKRGGEVDIVPLHSDFHVAVNDSNIDLLALDEALTRLAALDPQQAKVVEIRYFGGCSVEETAAILNISHPTVYRDWAMAKAWLKRELTLPQI